MKIAILVWDLNITGGTQRQALELAVQLQEAGNTVDVFCYLYDKERCYTELCDKLSIFSVTNTAPQRKTSDRKFFRRILGLLDIYKNTLLSIFVTDENMYRMKDLIIKTHPLDYYDTINIHDYQVYKIARILKHRSIVWMMNDIQRGAINSGNFIHQKLYNILQKILAHSETRNISKIVVLDKRNQSLCKKTYNKDAVIIRSGVDLNMFSGLSNKRDYKHQTWGIFASSIFFPYRRFEDLVDAIEILSKKGITDLSVTINGLPNRSYKYFLSIQDRIKSKGLEGSISILQGMSEGELKNMYLKSDIFIFPNNNQTWGLAVFEAMLAGCVCIVSRGAGAHEVLTNKENALIVNPLAPSEIADAIEFLIKNPNDMQRISENGNRFVKENLSWGKYAEQMLALFKNEI